MKAAGDEQIASAIAPYFPGVPIEIRNVTVKPVLRFGLNRQWSIVLGRAHTMAPAETPSISDIF